MKRDVVYVVTYGLKWKIKCDGYSDLICDSQEKAIKISRLHVAKLPKGKLSQILVQGKDSKFRAEWTYGKDPFPPKG